MRKILILMGRYLPGHRDGGPLRTMINVTETLGGEYDFHIACLDRDHGDEKRYPNVTMGEWNQVGKAKVWYVEPGGFTNDLILKLAEGKDMIYLSSFYDDYGYRTLTLRKKGQITCPVVLASMGVFSKEALGQKALKKKLFINGCKVQGLFRNITWSVTSELEADDVKRSIGKNIKYIVAEDLPRADIPGRSKDFSDRLRIVFLSRICEHKNLAVAIEAIADMKNKDVVFDIYGPVQEQDYWDKCKTMLDEAGLNWSYKGDAPSEEVQKILSGYDVMILPTKSENYGHVIFEALSVGCVPIISDRTPWEDVKNYNAGYVLKLDSKNFTEALDSFRSLSVKEKTEISDNALKLAHDKVENSRKNTGYRLIFG